LLIYFVLFNKNKLKQSILNKPIMGASCVIVKGGFEGLGDPEMDEQHVTPKPMRTINNSQITDLGVELPLTLSATQNESHSKDNSATFPRLNPEVNAVPVPDQPEGSNANPSTERRTSSGYPFWPRPPNEDNKNKKEKVRIFEYTEVTEISNLGLEENRDEIIKLGPKKKPHRHRADERDQNIIENSDPSNSNALNYFKGNKQKFRSFESRKSD
jgi:hypothetical protein